MNWRYTHDGDERTKSKFFFFPTLVGDRWYWLERRMVRQKYHTCCYCCSWDDVEVVG